MEYILILVVVMTIALGIGGPLGQYLKSFTGALLGPPDDAGKGGGYYSCLMMEGALPGSPTVENCGEDAQLALSELNKIKKGEGFTGGGGGGGLGGGGSFGGPNSQGSGPSSGDKGDGDSSDGSKSFREKHSSGSKKNNRSAFLSKNKYKGGSSSLSGEEAFIGEATFPSDGSKEGGSTSDKIKKRKKRDGRKLSSSEFKEEKNKTVKQNQTKGSTSDGVLGQQYYQQEEQEKEPRFKSSSVAKKSRSGAQEEESKGAAIKNEKVKDKADLEDEDKGLNFGGFLKYLIIAIMIIALIVVVFSQVMEYQNKD